MMVVEAFFGGWLAVNLISAFFVVNLLSDMEEVGMIKGAGKYKDVMSSKVLRIAIPLPYVAVLCSNTYRKSVSNRKGK